MNESSDQRSLPVTAIGGGVPGGVRRGLSIAEPGGGGGGNALQ